MSTDLSEFEELTNPKSTWSNPIKDALDGNTLTKTEKEQLREAIDRPPTQISNKAVAMWLERRGITVTWQKVRGYRERIAREQS